MLTVCTYLACLLIFVLPSVQAQAYPNDEVCKTRCEKDRPRALLADHTFTCEEIYTIGSPEYDECTKDCFMCSKCFHSRGIQQHTYICPRIELDENCLEFCRDNPAKMASVVECKNLPEGSNKSCDICHKYNCPSWFCKYDDEDQVVFCPIFPLKDGGKVGDSCKKHCEIQRYEHDVLDFEDFQFHCDDIVDGNKIACAGDCRNRCPPEICNQNIDNKVYNCPALAPYPADPTEVVSKRGCHERCDKYRRGGDKKYDLNCDIFSTPEEKRSCKQDCALCPTEICDPNGPMAIFHCPGSSDTETDEQIHNTALVVSIVLIILATVLLCVVATVAYFLIRKRIKMRKQVVAFAGFMPLPDAFAKKENHRKSYRMVKALAKSSEEASSASAGKQDPDLASILDLYDMGDDRGPKQKKVKKAKGK